eukprot:GFUD01080349.1.p1 GENE.GFUD01080349.1~~GFUD01080349.1.p1  ORF type:complete len:110 (+),score=29.09 GFUD01080349.1:139-468(+)
MLQMDRKRVKISSRVKESVEYGQNGDTDCNLWEAVRKNLLEHEKKQPVKLYRPRQFTEWQRPLCEWLEPLNEWQRPLNEWQQPLSEWYVPSGSRLSKGKKDALVEIIQP